MIFFITICIFISVLNFRLLDSFSSRHEGHLMLCNREKFQRFVSMNFLFVILLVMQIARIKTTRTNLGPLHMSPVDRAGPVSEISRYL